MTCIAELLHEWGSAPSAPAKAVVTSKLDASAAIISPPGSPNSQNFRSVVSSSPDRNALARVGDLSLSLLLLSSSSSGATDMQESPQVPTYAAPPQERQPSAFDTRCDCKKGLSHDCVICCFFCCAVPVNTSSNAPKGLGTGKTSAANNQHVSSLWSPFAVTTMFEMGSKL